MLLLEGASVWWLWLFFAVRPAMTWTAFIMRENDIGITVIRAEELVRHPLTTALLVAAGMAFVGSGPIASGLSNVLKPYKMGLYAFALCIGLFLWLVMRRWTGRFRILAMGPNAE